MIWQEHVLMRMLERNIDREEVKDVLRAADVIEDYPNDTPHPSVLLYGKVDDRELHVVAAFDAARQAIHAITAYDPDLFEAGYRRRRDR